MACLSAGLDGQDIYPKLKKNFYIWHSSVIWKEFLTTKFGLWIDTGSITYNTLHNGGRAVEKCDIFLQIEKVVKSSDGDLMSHVSSLEDAVAHLAVSDPIQTLTIEK